MLQVKQMRRNNERHLQMRPIKPKQRSHVLLLREKQKHNNVTSVACVCHESDQSGVKHKGYNRIVTKRQIDE